MGNVLALPASVALPLLSIIFEYLADSIYLFAYRLECNCFARLNLFSGFLFLILLFCTRVNRLAMKIISIDDHIIVLGT